MSKSVTLRTSDARTGRKKKTKIRASAGARKSHAAFPTSDGVCAPGSRDHGKRLLSPPTIPGSGSESSSPDAAPSGGMVALNYPPYAGSSAGSGQRLRMSSAHSGQRSLAFRLRQQVPSFPEHGVYILIQLRQSLIYSLRFANCLLPVLIYGSSDLLPLRHLRQRHHPFELIAKRLRVLVVRQRRVLPRRLPRRQIAGEHVKLELHRGAG